LIFLSWLCVALQRKKLLLNAHRLFIIPLGDHSLPGFIEQAIVRSSYWQNPPHTHYELLRDTSGTDPGSWLIPKGLKITRRSRSTL